MIAFMDDRSDPRLVSGLMSGASGRRRGVALVLALSLLAACGSRLDEGEKLAVTGAGGSGQAGPLDQGGALGDVGTSDGATSDGSTAGTGPGATGAASSGGTGSAG